MNIAPKRKVLAVLTAVLLMAFPVGASAENGDTFSDGGLTYTILTEDGDTSRGTVLLNGFEKSGWAQLDIPAAVTHGGVDYDLTAIGKAAFYDCSSLTSVRFAGAKPADIGQSAFACLDSTANADIALASLTAIRVPAGSLAAYRATAGLSDYSDIVRA